MTDNVPDLNVLTLNDEENIDDAIATHARLYETIGRQLSRLRTHRNNTIPTISRIPREVLAEIITIFAWQHRQQHAEYEPFKWLWITHVCSLWRSIALALPELWNVIPTGHYRECTEAYVVRSVALPLSIVPGRMDACEDLNPRFVLPILPAVYRLRELKLYLVRNTMMGLLNDTYFPELINSVEIAPSLESLSLSYMSFEDDADPPDDFWFLTFASMPKLRELQTSYLPFALVASLAQPSLTRLELSMMNISNFDADDILKLLEKLPQLRHLEISDLDTSIPFQQSPIPATSGSFALIHLRYVRLSGQRTASARLLNHLVIPSNCMMMIWDSNEAVAGYSFIYTVVASKKNGAGCVGPPQALIYMRIDRNGGIELWDDVEDGPPCDNWRPGCKLIARKPTVDLVGQSSRFMFEAISDTTLPLQNLQLLCLQGIEIPHGFFAILSSRSYITELHCHGNKYMRQMLEQLGGVLCAHDPHGSDIPLPRLRSLKLCTPKWHPHPGVCPRAFEGEPLSTAIDTLLHARDEMGIPLGELHVLDIRFFDEHNDMEWFTRMSSGPLQFEWTRCLPALERCSPLKCDICGDSDWAGWGRIGDEYEYF